MKFPPSLGTLSGDAAVLAAIRNDVLAKTFGVSKTQVTTVLQLGEAAGDFALDAAGVPAATELLRTTLRKWVATELAFCARHMQPADAAPQATGLRPPVARQE